MGLNITMLLIHVNSWDAHALDSFMYAFTLSCHIHLLTINIYDKVLGYVYIMTSLFYHKSNTLGYIHIK